MDRIAAVCHGDDERRCSMILDWTIEIAGRQAGRGIFNAIRTAMTMPPEAEGRARTTSVWNLVIYIRSLPKQQPAAAPPQALETSSSPQTGSAARGRSWSPFDVQRLPRRGVGLQPVRKFSVGNGSEGCRIRCNVSRWFSTRFSILVIE